jgi:hypothetical protein
MSAGLSHEAVPISKLERGAVSCVAFNVRIGSLADMSARISDVGFVPKSGHRRSQHQRSDETTLVNLPN